MNKLNLQRKMDTPCGPDLILKKAKKSAPDPNQNKQLIQRNMSQKASQRSPCLQADMKKRISPQRQTGESKGKNKKDFLKHLTLIKIA